MNAPAAWDLSRGDGVVVAVLDSGVDPNQPDLQGQLVPGWNLYDNNSNTSDVYGHGTKVAGVIAAASNNGYRCHLAGLECPHHAGTHQLDQWFGLHQHHRQRPDLGRRPWRPGRQYQLSGIRHKLPSSAPRNT